MPSLRRLRLHLEGRPRQAERNRRAVRQRASRRGDRTARGPRPHGATGVYEVLLHELGHLVGLDHVTDKNQVMYPTLTHPIGHYAPGDVAGLAILGNGARFTDY